MGYDGKYGNQQSYGNKNGSGGGFQKTFEDKTEIPEPVKVQSFYKPDGKTLKEDLFDSVALDVAKSFKGKNKKGNDIGMYGGSGTRPSSYVDPSLKNDWRDYIKKGLEIFNSNGMPSTTLL